MTMPLVRWTAAMIRMIKQHALETYPAECCGVILGPCQTHGLTRLYRIANIQQACHQTDPKAFPSTERQAFFMDPQELLKVQKTARQNGEEIKVIYHSHPDTQKAYFSKEDAAMALAGGKEPAYPGVVYVVTALTAEGVQTLGGFYWSAEEKSFRSYGLEIKG